MADLYALTQRKVKELQDELDHLTDVLSLQRDVIAKDAKVMKILMRRDAHYRKVIANLQNKLGR